MGLSVSLGCNGRRTPLLEPGNLTVTQTQSWKEMRDDSNAEPFHSHSSYSFNVHNTSFRVEPDHIKTLNLLSTQIFDMFTPKTTKEDSTVRISAESPSNLQGFFFFFFLLLYIFFYF